MFCAISGVTPEDPVVSKKSGHVFEKSLVLKALAASGGKCPATGEDLEEADLIPVQLSGDVVRPVPSTAVTLPGLLKHIQNEWEAVMLESHQVKQALAVAHQELAAALYKYDASTRVIARLLEERDEARAALAKLPGTSHGKSARAASEPEDVEMLSDRRKGDDDTENGDSREAVVGERSDEPISSANGTSDKSVVKNRPDEKRSNADLSSSPGDVADLKDGDINLDVPAASATLKKDAGRDDASTDDKAVSLSARKVPDDVLDVVRTKNKELTSMRKGRKPSKNILSRNSIIRGYKVTHSVNLGLDTQSETLLSPEASLAVSCMLTIPEKPKEESAGELLEDTLVVGCTDGAICIINSSDFSTCALALPGCHPGGVTSIACNSEPSPSMLFSGGNDGILRGWKMSVLLMESNGKPPEKRRRTSRHQGDSSSVSADSIEASVEIEDKDLMPVVGVAVHPSGEYVLSTIASGRWRMHSIKTGTLLACGLSDGPVESCGLHPDGAIFAIGLANGTLDLWDLSREEGHLEPVVKLGGGVAKPGCARTITMSENGCYAVIAGAGRVCLWDLRTSKLTREALMSSSSSLGDMGNNLLTNVPAGIALDASGVYCAVSCGDGAVRLFETKKLKILADVGEPIGRWGPEEKNARSVNVVGVAWGRDARCVYVGTSDGRVLRLGEPVNKPNEPPIVE